MHKGVVGFNNISLKIKWPSVSTYLFIQILFLQYILTLENCFITVFVFLTSENPNISNFKARDRFAIYEKKRRVFRRVQCTGVFPDRRLVTVHHRLGHTALSHGCEFKPSQNHCSIFALCPLSACDHVTQGLRN